MTFNHVKELLSDASDLTLLDNVFNDKFERPYLIDAIVNILSDDSLYKNVLNEEKTMSLFRLCKEYFQTCFSVFLDQSMGGVRIDLLLPYATTTVYHTDAPDGYRISTVNEVKEGIEEIIPEVTYNITEEVIDNLNLLLWTITGRVRYYRAAGLECTFTDGRLDETDLQLIYRAGNKLRLLVDWISNKSEYERTITILKLAKKNSKYTYPNYAKDEIKPETSLKQAQFICKTRLYGKKLNEEQTEAKRLVYKIDKGKYKPLPHEMAIIRRVARKLQDNLEPSIEEDLPPELAEICTRFDVAEQKGYISSNEFVFKIIESIRKYKRCSPKQMAIIKEAENKIMAKMKEEEKEQKIEEETPEKDKSAQEMIDMYKMLGSGVLEI